MRLPAKWGRASEPALILRRWKPRRWRCAARWRIWRSSAAALDEAIRRVLEGLPNVLDPDVPDGPDETANIVLTQHGEPRDLGFQPKQHFELGEALGMMDFADRGETCGRAVRRAARPAGAAGAGARPVHDRPAHARARLHRDSGAVAGERRDGLRYRQAAEVCRYAVPDDGRTVAYPNGRGAADRAGDGRHPRREGLCRCASPR